MSEDNGKRPVARWDVTRDMHIATVLHDVRSRLLADRFRQVDISISKGLLTAHWPEFGEPLRVGVSEDARWADIGDGFHIRATLCGITEGNSLDDWGARERSRNGRRIHLWYRQAYLQKFFRCRWCGDEDFETKRCSCPEREHNIVERRVVHRRDEYRPQRLVYGEIYEDHYLGLIDAIVQACFNWVHVKGKIMEGGSP